jgi:hypothetical protein
MVVAWTAPRTWLDGDTPDDDLLNAHIRDNLEFLSVHTHSGAAGMGAADLVPDSITFADSAASPTAAGELRRNGVNLEYFGSAVVAVTEVDAVAGTGSPRTIGTGALQGAPGDHGHSSSNHTQSTPTRDTNASGTHTYHPKIGKYDLTDTVTVLVYSATTTKKISAFVFYVAILESSSGVTMKAELKADGVVIASNSISGGSTGAPQILVAVVVKNTADIAWRCEFDRSGSAGTDAGYTVDVVGNIVSTAGTNTTTPQTRYVQADLGAA